MTITDAAMAFQYCGAPIPLVSLQIAFFVWGHVKDAVSGRQRHSLPERSQLAALPFASFAPHDMLGRTGGSLLTAVTSAVSAASTMWRFNQTSSTFEYL
jgi:hypothetical protein